MCSKQACGKYKTYGSRTAGSVCEIHSILRLGCRIYRVKTKSRLLKLSYIKQHLHAAVMCSGYYISLGCWLQVVMRGFVNWRITHSRTDRVCYVAATKGRSVANRGGTAITCVFGLCAELHHSRSRICCCSIHCRLI